MWFWDKVIAILTFPVRWFWNTYREYKEERCMWKVIVLFVTSLSGVILFAIALVWLIRYLFTFHKILLLAIVAILWLYAYVKEKMTEKESVAFVQSQKQLNEQAEKNYLLMRNIIYQTLRSSATSIGAVMPRLVQEIELLETHYVISNGICFYQFKVNKADINMMYMKEELEEFRRVLQTTISRKIQAGDFPRMQFENFVDNVGNIYDAVSIDMIEDIDSFFVIQAVFTSKAYADYYRNKEMNKQAMRQKNSIPNASWDDET